MSASSVSRGNGRCHSRARISTLENAVTVEISPYHSLTATQGTSRSEREVLLAAPLHFPLQRRLARVPQSRQVIERFGERGRNRTFNLLIGARNPTCLLFQAVS